MSKMSAMVGRFKSFIIWALMLLAALWAGGWLRAQMMQPESLQLSSLSLPQLSAGQISDEEVAVAVGKPRLVYLFAPWCRICQFTFPHIESWQQQGLRVTPIALSYASVEEIKVFVAQSDTQVEVLLGSRQLADYLDVVAFPTYLILDADGQIVSKRVGYLPEWMLSMYLGYYGV